MMVKALFVKFKENPLHFLRQILFKIFVFPFRYGARGDYDASRYWQERFQKHGLSYQGVGDEGLSEEDNRQMYLEAAKIFKKHIQESGLNLQNARVLEIGCGIGFYTQILKELGVQNYVGVDITTVLFPDLKKKFPEFQFIQKDITAQKLGDRYDLIVMVDVLEHIVNESKFNFAMDSIHRALTDNGVFVIGPLFKKRQKHLFHVHFWALDDIQQKFSEFFVAASRPFRNGFIVRLQNKK